MSEPTDLKDTDAAAAELEDARKKAATYPTRMLSKAYQDAKRAGKTEVAEILRQALKSRNG